jgi:hypothetical protein
MSKKLLLNQIEHYPQLLDELNSLLVQGAEATIEDGRIVINYSEQQTQRAKSRNAGRKVFGPAKAESYKAFYKHYEEGKSMQEISKEIGMSLASCYRYKQDADSINEPPEAIGNRKYLLYRSEGNLNRDIRKHVLVAVEYGKDIYDVEEKLIRDVCDDLTEFDPHGKYELDAFEPELITTAQKTKKYKYWMEGIVYGADNGLNLLIKYGIVEK